MRLLNDPSSVIVSELIFLFAQTTVWVLLCAIQSIFIFNYINNSIPWNSFQWYSSVRMKSVIIPIQLYNTRKNSNLSTVKPNVFVKDLQFCERCDVHNISAFFFFFFKWFYISEPELRSWSSSSHVWRGNFAGCWRSQVRDHRLFSTSALLLSLFPALKSVNFGFTDHLKSREEQQREKKLLQRLMEIVDGRNAIVEGLDEDRLR